MEPGAHVHVGETVMVSDEPVTRARLAMSEGRVAELEARLEALRFSKRVDAAVVATELMQVHSELAREQDRIARLVVRSGAEGVLAISRPRDLPGRYLHEGDLVGYVLPDSGTRIVRVTVGQDDVAVMRQRLREISVKIVGHLAQTYSARLLREVPAGLDELPSKALAVAGGGSMAVDPRDTKGTKTIERIFHIDIELSRDAPADMFGARAHVRFDLAWEPLGTQIYRRLRQLLLARLQA